MPAHPVFSCSAYTQANTGAADAPVLTLFSYFVATRVVEITSKNCNGRGCGCRRRWAVTSLSVLANQRDATFSACRARRPETQRANPQRNSLKAQNTLLWKLISVTGEAIYSPLVRSHHHQVEMSEGGKKTTCGRNITFGNITKENINQLRKMNASIFPVRYHDKFYADVPSGNPDFNQFGEFRNIWCVFERVGQLCRTRPVVHVYYGTTTV